MKKNLIVFLGLFLGVLSMNAQDFTDKCWGETDSEKTLCKEAYSIWQGDYKQGNIDVAYDSWLRVRTACPACVHEKLYTEGAKYFSSFIKSAETEELKQQFVDSLLMVYTMRIENFPKSAAKVKGSYGTALFKYRQDQFDDAQIYLKESVKGMKEKSSPTVIQAYYSTIAQQFSRAVEAKDTVVIKEKKIELLKTFVELDEYTEGAIELWESRGEKGKKKADKYRTMRENLLKIFLQLDSNCDSLEPLVMENLYKEGDPKSCKTALTILTLKECTEGENYPMLAECSDDGSHKSAFSVAIIYLKTQNYEKADEWFDTALERCGDCEDKESYLLRAGQTGNLSGNISKAKKMARQVLELNSSSGDAYLILADAWTKSNCGDEAFGKACSFWIAYDYYAKAKSLNPELADKANKSMSSIRSGWPSVREVNQQGLTIGGTYSCCGVTTTIRTRD